MTAVEYGVIAAGIVALIIALVFEIGPYLETAFTTVRDELKGGTTP